MPDPEIDATALCVRFAELISEEDANATARGLCLAHVDAHLKGSVPARAFLDEDLASAFAARGI